MTKTRQKLQKFDHFFTLSKVDRRVTLGDEIRLSMEHISLSEPFNPACQKQEKKAYN
jgi:hypothetical protein